MSPRGGKAPTSGLTVPKSQSVELRKAQLRKLYLTDLFALSRQLLYADVKTPMTPAFHGSVCRFRQTSPFRRNMYLLSRDHLKTSLLTCAGNVQRILRDPSVRILLASNKADNAQAQLSEIKGHLTNEVLIWLFPDVLFDDPVKQTQWATEAITVKRKRRTKESTIETIGAEGAITGRHYEHGQFDDLVDEQNSQTKLGLEKIIHWYKTTQSLFEPGATQEIVGTPWAFGDLYEWAIEQKIKREFSLGVYRQPCWRVHEPGVLRLGKRNEIAEDVWLLDAAGRKQPVFPEKHTRADLEERHRVDSRIFAAQWLLRPVDDETAMFPRGKAVIRRRETFPALDKLWKVMTIDPAISTNNWADYGAIAVVGFAADGNMYVLDLRRGRWNESMLVNEVYDAWYRTPGILSVGIEAIAFQKLLLNEFTRAGEARGHYLPISKLERESNKTKPVRIRALEPFWTAQQIIFADDLVALDDFLEEAERFRPWRENLHDDMLDALADTIQLRVRPQEADPDDGYTDEDRERRSFEREFQAKNPRVDRASLRNAWQMHRRRQLWKEKQENEVLGDQQIEEFFTG